MKKIFFLINLTVLSLTVYGQNTKEKSKTVEVNGVFVQNGIESWLFFPIGDTSVVKWNCINNLNSHMFRRGFKVSYILDTMESEIFKKSVQYRNTAIPDDLADNLKFIRITFARVKYEPITDRNRSQNSKKTKVYDYNIQIDQTSLKLKYDLSDNKFIEVYIKDVAKE